MMTVLAWIALGVCAFDLLFFGTLYVIKTIDDRRGGDGQR